MEVTLYTISKNDSHQVINDPEILENGNYLLKNNKGESIELPARMIRKWWFKFKPYTGIVAIDLQKRLVSANLGNFDTYEYRAAKGTYLAQLLMEDWNRTTIMDGVESKLPITDITVGNLPYTILATLLPKLEMGDSYTLEELEQAKKDLNPSELTT